MRFSLEPLPRTGSPRHIAVVVAMLVGGIALSVHEYLESERTPPRREVHAGSSETADVGPKRIPFGPTCTAPAPARGSVASECKTSPNATPSFESTTASPAPSAFDPESG